MAANLFDFVLFPILPGLNECALYVVLGERTLLLLFFLFVKRLLVFWLLTLEQLNWLVKGLGWVLAFVSPVSSSTVFHFPKTDCAVKLLTIKTLQINPKYILLIFQLFLRFFSRYVGWHLIQNLIVKYWN